MGGQPNTFGRNLARKLAIDLSIMTVLGAVLALLGPFGSFNDPLAIRLVVWIGLAWAGYFIYSPVGWVVERMHRALDLPRLGLWIAGTLVATIPMTIVVWSLGQFARGEFAFPTAQVALAQYSYVLLIGGGLTVLFNIIERARHGAPQAEPTSQGSVVSEPSASKKVPRLLDRLPPELGTDIVALEMEDHYVRVHTALGSDLLLMRMRDAVAELEGLDGMQVHRSWWVARGAVEDVEREGRNVRLALGGDLKAPVSRANVQVLKDAGWI